MKYFKIPEHVYLFVWSFSYPGLSSPNVLYNITIIKHGFRNHTQEHSCGEGLNSYVFFSSSWTNIEFCGCYFGFFFLSFFFFLTVVLIGGICLALAFMVSELGSMILQVKNFLQVMLWGKGI